MDVLIAPVGKQDPYSEKNGQAGSVLVIAVRIKPAIVYLLPTRKPPEADEQANDTIEEAGKTAAELKALLPGVCVEIFPLALARPHMPDEALAALEPLVRTIQAECAIWQEDGPVTLHVNAGSGTPAIKQAIVLLVSSGILAAATAPVSVYIVDDPERVPPGADRLHRVDISHIEEMRLRPIIEALVAARQWALARAHLERLGAIVSDAERAALLRTLARMLEVFALLDRLAYVHAHDAVRTLRQRTETRSAAARMPQLDDLLAEFTAIAERLVQGDRAAILYDLLTGVQHRLAREEYADALARAWYILAAMLEWRLATHHNLDVEAQPLLTPAQEQVLGDTLYRYNDRRVKPEQNVYGLWEALVLLNDSAWRELSVRKPPAALVQDLNATVQAQIRSGGSLGQALEWQFRAAVRAIPPRLPITDWSEVRAYLNVARNHSVAAHGEQEVPKVAARAAEALVSAALRAIQSPVAALTDTAHLDMFDRCCRLGLALYPASDAGSGAIA